MQVYVKLFATLARHVPEDILAQRPEGIRAGTPLEIELPEGSTIADLVDHLALPQELLKVTFVNGRAQELDYSLQPGDQVGIFPPVAGG